MRYDKLNQKKGVAGLNILMSIIAMLFMIGLVVMVFTLAGSKMGTAVSTRSDSATITNETLTTVDNVTAEDLSVADYWRCASSITTVTNATDGATISSGNYTASGCTIVGTATMDSNFLNTNWNVTYDWSYIVNGEAEQTINATYQSIGDVADWFSTFIVLGAMVVLILLVVIVINSIKQSGITDGA